MVPIARPLTHTHTHTHTHRERERETEGVGTENGLSQTSTKQGQAARGCTPAAGAARGARWPPASRQRSCSRPASLVCNGARAPGFSPSVPRCSAQQAPRLAPAPSVPPCCAHFMVPGCFIASPLPFSFSPASPRQSPPRQLASSPAPSRPHLRAAACHTCPASQLAHAWSPSMPQCRTVIPPSMQPPTHHIPSPTSPPPCRICL